LNGHRVGKAIRTANKGGYFSACAKGRIQIPDRRLRDHGDCQPATIANAKPARRFFLKNKLLIFMGSLLPGKNANTHMYTILRA
jgi:hypothetical protein